MRSYRRDPAPNSTLSLKDPLMSVHRVDATKVRACTGKAPAGLTRLATSSIKFMKNKPVRMARPAPVTSGMKLTSTRTICRYLMGNLPTLVTPSPTAITTAVSNRRAASRIKISIVTPMMTASRLMKLRSLSPRLTQKEVLKT